jgi:hypothetical protein
MVRNVNVGATYNSLSLQPFIYIFLIMYHQNTLANKHELHANTKKLEIDGEYYQLAYK